MIDRLRGYISKFTLQDWIFLIFALFWVGIIFIDYINKQVVYGPSFRYFRYFKLFGFFTVIGSLLSLYYNRLFFLNRLKFNIVNGIMVLLLVIGIIWAVTLSFNHYWKAPLDFSHFLHLAGMALFTLGSAFFLITACYSIGRFLRKRLIESPETSLTFALLDIAIGFIAYTFIMMALGAFALLNQVLLLGIMALFILLNYEEALGFVKRVLWSPITKPKGFNFWGGFLAFFILVYLTMNYLYTQAPFPLGFDARNYYVNIANLISDAGALISGFSPYAWSLVMSTGYIAFDSPEVTMFISSLGGILCLFAIYEFAHHHLKVSSNMSLLVVMLFMVSPTVTNHWMIEFKVDLALLFFQMVTLNLVMWWLFEYKKNNSQSTLLETPFDTKLVVIIGILLGYGLSIKVLSVFLVYALFLALWNFHKDIIGMLSVASLGFGLVLLARLDDLSGLREYHLSPNVTGGICLALGLAGLLYSFVQSKEKFIASIKPLILCGAVMALTFSPWMYKNYTYTKSLSIMKLVIGEKPSPKINASTIISNYRESQKKNEQ